MQSTRNVLGLLAALLIGVAATEAYAADEPVKKEEPAAPAAGETSKPEAATPAVPAPAAAGAKMSPKDRVAATEKGKLKNPFTDNAEAIAQGKKLYLGNSCNGCHGGGGGGGMCPPLTNERWVYGSDDDTLFRLITLGSAGLKAQGYAPIAKETVTGPMPPYEEIIHDEDVLWKIIAYVRSVYSGRAEKRDW